MHEIDFSEEDPLFFLIEVQGTSLVVQWVRLHAPSAGGLGSMPGQGTRSHMHAATKSLHATGKIPRAAAKARSSLNK